MTRNSSGRQSETGTASAIGRTSYEEVSRKVTDYRLPDGRIVGILEDVARGARWVSFTLIGGRVVMAERMEVRCTVATVDAMALETLREVAETLRELGALLASVEAPGPARLALADEATAEAFRAESTAALLAAYRGTK